MAELRDDVMVEDAAPLASDTDTPLGPLGHALLHAAQEARTALDTRDPVKSVHDLRKAFKRLRALLRLVRGRKKAHDALALERALADAARRLSGARDHAARQEALDDLVAKAELAPEHAQAAMLALSAPEESGHATLGVGPHEADLNALVYRCLIDTPRFAGAMSTGQLVEALADDYARARRRGRKVDPADAEGLHDLRKAVIAQRYQMGLVTPLWPRLGKVWEDELQRLRDKLGKHHDLAVLAARLAAYEPGAQDEAWHAAVSAAAGARQQRLAQSALHLHRRLFAERPRTFRRRIAAYFDPVSKKE
ncbi:CHAD domain-containing protein [Ancylobacter mangrovi]|uniref:CHAD domain-containing protein n=1 Tax=Ancylobacter mangrovi TaxID=2972472 RepID=UPI0021637BAF|nr:CHAD domain-containing protein [Ancylobacter mangrovi]MCS0500772.1 CHAD domain-containing protein [Ancylobacter mangrovi]